MKQRKAPVLLATVTYPDDLQPAIDALGAEGKQKLDELAAGGEVKPAMIARAADYEREVNG